MKKLFKKLKKNSKGFTLVELLVTLGILSVVMIMVGSIIKMGSGTYMGISNDLSLQSESQMTMSQIQEYVIDCNNAVASISGAVTGDVLYLFDKSGEDGPVTYDGYKMELSDDGTLWLYTSHVEEPTTGGFGSGEPMSRNVTAFNAELVGPSDSVSSVIITLTYELGGETYTGEQTVAFRNPVQDLSETVSG